MNKRTAAIFVSSLFIATTSSLALHAETSNGIAFSFSAATGRHIFIGERRQLRITGDVHGIAVSGAGTATWTPATMAMLDEQPAFVSEYQFRGTATSKKSGANVNIEGHFFSYYDADYNLIARIQGNEVSGDADEIRGAYEVTISKDSLPSVIHVNDFGSLSATTIYKDKTKAVTLSVSSRSYRVEPDSPTSVIYCVSERYFDTNRKLLRQIEERYRIHADGSYAFVSQETIRPRSRLLVSAE
jgi:hypothetical protein